MNLESIIAELKEDPKLRQLLHQINTDENMKDVFDFVYILAHESGYNEGYEDGKAVGYEDGYDSAVQNYED